MFDDTVDMQDRCPADIDILVKIVGPDATNRIVDEFAGQSIYIPKNYKKRSLHGSIAEDYRAGMSYRDLARKYHFTVSWIREICKKDAESRRKTAPKNFEIQFPSR